VTSSLACYRSYLLITFLYVSGSVELSSEAR
jgi:hypothetical protein